MLHCRYKYCEFLLICGIPIFVNLMESIKPRNQKFQQGEGPLITNAQIDILTKATETGINEIK